MNVELRPATAADDEFCFQLHRAAMGDYVAAIWGWDDEVQRGYHQRAFTPGEWQIIVVDGVDTGMLSVDRRPDEIYLGRIEILPDHQGRGIGAELIVRLREEARRRGCDLVLDVLDVNARALALYSRLGLREVSRDGAKIRMRYTPGQMEGH